MAESTTAPTVSTEVEGAGEAMVVSPVAPVGDVEKAKKQGVYVRLDLRLVNTDGYIVEFYFADSNLPYDKYGISLWLSGFEY